MTDPIAHEIARLRIWAQGRELTREQYAADPRAASDEPDPKEERDHDA